LDSPGSVRFGPAVANYCSGPNLPDW